LLSSNDLEFDEFDLLAQAPPGTISILLLGVILFSVSFLEEPAVKPKSRTHAAKAHPTKEKESTVAELLDGRLSNLMEMGFSQADSEWALMQCEEDVNRALNLLLKERSPKEDTEQI
jgi:hypothetical protein